MGNGVSGFNKVFGSGSAESEGGAVAGMSPEDWAGGGAFGGNKAGMGRAGQNFPTTPQAPEAPATPQFVAPAFYAPRQSQLQTSTYNPASTSHNYLARFGSAKHI